MATFDIILTVFNRLEYTKSTFASLLNSGVLRDCQRFIIVDNHSTEEGMQDWLKDIASYQKVFVIHRPQNDGWGMAVNDGLGLSRAEFVLISNNDVDYNNAGFHHSMMSILIGNDKIGILGAWRHTAHGVAQGSDTNGSFIEMDNVPAVAWMLPKRAMERVGMIPEHGPCQTKGGNGEDTDYVMRMKQMGLLTGVTKVDLARHLDGY